MAVSPPGLTVLCKSARVSCGSQNRSRGNTAREKRDRRCGDSDLPRPWYEKIYAAKGAKVVQLNLKKDQPSDEEIAQAIVGPSGNLRAPSLRVGKTLVVGFNPDMYSKGLPG